MLNFFIGRIILRKIQRLIKRLCMPMIDAAAHTPLLPPPHTPGLRESIIINRTPPPEKKQLRAWLVCALHGCSFPFQNRKIILNINQNVPKITRVQIQFFKQKYNS